MIAFLRGRLLEKQPNRVIVDVQGVGYDVHVPLSTFYGLPEPGGDVALRVHTHVREDALALFGFTTSLEQQIFERLLAVSGIGPRLALAVLSGIEPPDLVQAVQRNDIARLTSIPGVGKKTAERIGLELKDRLATLVAPPEAERAPVAGPPDGVVRDDVLSALLNLGYHRPLAERAVEASIRTTNGTSFQDVLRQALKELSR